MPSAMRVLGKSPVMVRLKLAEKAALKAILDDEGVTSMSSWFRQLAVRKIREAAQVEAQRSLQPKT